MKKYSFFALVVAFLLGVAATMLLHRFATGGFRSRESRKMMKVALQRDLADHANFKSEDIAKAEELYVQAARMMRDDRSKPLLDSVVARYPQLNRAGCAQLYRAQQEYGPEKERLLKDCIARFSDWDYFDGTQVGPFAMLQLASYYKQTGRTNEADELFKRLRTESPEAVDHTGTLLVDMAGK